VEERRKRDEQRLPPVGAIPEQSNRKAITFSASRKGPLDLDPDPLDDPFDPEQADLYSRMRNQLNQLKETIPSQERHQINDSVDDFLAQPANWRDVQFKKVLWLCGNSMRNILAQHDAARNDPEPHHAKLPPPVAEAFRRPVETWNIFVLGDSNLRELDAYRLGPQEQEEVRNALLAAMPVANAAAEDRHITTPKAAAVIKTSISLTNSPSNNIHSRQVQEVTSRTWQNLIVQILRGAYRVAQDIQDPRTDDAKELVKEYKAGIYKKLGEWTVIGAATAATATAVAVGTTTYMYSIPFFEFVVSHGPSLKAYLAITFQNVQLTNIIDAIAAIRARLTSQ